MFDVVESCNVTLLVGIPSVTLWFNHSLCLFVLQLAKKYHPDANQDKSYAKRKSQEIRDAYEVLSFIVTASNIYFEHMVAFFQLGPFFNLQFQWISGFARF